MKELLHGVKRWPTIRHVASAKRLEGDVRIDDPGALRALAHPARLTVIDELYQGVERTSSELAELTGLSPSAMSYHLRALERWGMVERGEPREDGRERPWRAVGRTLSLDPETVSAAATDVVAGTTLQHLRDEFRRWAMVEQNEGGGSRFCFTLPVREEDAG